MQSIVLEEKATYFRQVLAPPFIWGQQYYGQEVSKLVN